MKQMVNTVKDRNLLCFIAVSFTNEVKTSA